MKRLFTLLVIGAAACCLHAQVVDTTVCDVLKNPQSFNGKTVRIKGTVATTFDQFVVKDSGCGQHINAIWLSYPDGAKAKSGPAAILQLQPARNFAGKHEFAQRTPVVLEKSKDFKQFDSLLNTPHKSTGMCLGCARYTVSATLVGRLDGVAEAGVKRDAAGKIIDFEGFGNLNEYKARLVLQSVSEVTPHEIDYSKSDEASKSLKEQPAAPAGPGPSGSVDPLDAAHQSALGFGAGNAMGAQIERAAAGFGKSGEHNGAYIKYGNTGEAEARDDAPGKNDSPDGILFNCTFNTNRLPTEVISKAIVHMGEHIADLRNPTKESAQFGPFELEFQAWEMSTLSAIATGQKTLTMPGGYIVWSTAWTATERDNMINEALMKYLTTEELFTR